MRRSTIVLLAALAVALLLAVTSALASDTRVTGKATASTSFSTHPAKYMNDGTTSTYWAASTTALPQWAMIDLGAAKSLSACDIVWRGAPGFRIYGSNDAVNWTELANQELNYMQTTHTVVKGIYRYVRVRVYRLRARQAAGIYEWEISASSSAATPSPTPTAAVTAVPIPAPTPTIASPAAPTQTPTATVTPIPTPTATVAPVTPAVTPNATVAPTPTPTTSAVGPAPGTVFTQSGPLHLTSGQNLVYNGVEFSGDGYGSGDWGALVFLEGQGQLSNITFRNCIINTNTDGSGNGIKVVDLGGGRVHDITFDHCLIRYQPRMGAEINGRAIENGIGGQGYLRVNITNSRFEASAGEAISYDSNPGDLSGQSVVSGNYVDGAGVGAKYQYGKVFEINGTHNMTVTNNYFGAGRDGILNLQGRDAQAEGWKFAGNTYDAKHVPAGVSPAHELGYFQNIAGGATFADRFVNGGSYTSSTWAYMTGCRNVDFGASTVSGAPAALPSGYMASSSGITWPKAQ